MSADSMDYTTCTWHRGLYRFKVMPYGLTSAPMSFNRVMRKLLYKSNGLDNYLDDVLAHSAGWTEHLQDLEDFFLRIQKANLSLRPTKCQIGYQTIDFLGHRITEDSIEPNPKKLEKILESSRPETKTQIKSFLGLIGYYQQFLPHYSNITTPLTDLLEKNLPNKITWGIDQEKAFQTLKTFILNSRVLKLPKLDQPFILRCDPSDYAIAGVLLQEHENLLHPISFCSKKLSSRERNYPICEKECFSIIWSIQRFQKILYAKHFYIEIDHSPLKILNKSESKNSRLMRLNLILQPYRFTIKEIPGKLNFGADLLSRHFSNINQSIS